MKKITLLALIIFCSQLVFAQHVRSSCGQKKSFSLSDKIKSKAPTLNMKKQSSAPFRAGATVLPIPNSIWQPGKMIESSWDTAGNAWLYNDSTLYSYNINGDVTLEAFCFSSVAECQTVYTYNINSKLIEILWQYWNGTSWDNGQRINYTYDSNNNLIQEINQNWNGSSWDNTYQSLYTYNAGNNRIQTVGQIWNTGSWVNQWKEDNTYNVSNQLIYYVDQIWNGSSWDNSFKEEFSYNGSGEMNYALDLSWGGAAWDTIVQYINIVWYQWTGNIFSRPSKSHFKANISSQSDGIA